MVIFDTRNSALSSAWPFLNTLAYKSCDTAEAPDRVNPETTARIVANATADIKPKNTLPPTAFAKWMAAMLLPPNSSPTPSLKAGLVLTNTMAPKPIMNVKI